MLRDKFLHQVRTDKGCIEEGKKVTKHAIPWETPGYSLSLDATESIFISYCKMERINFLSSNR